MRKYLLLLALSLCGCNSSTVKNPHLTCDVPGFGPLSLKGTEVKLISPCVWELTTEEGAKLYLSTNACIVASGKND